ncbi:hypothetical protein Pat9b_5023 (plasmid) [Pantoea sp. At-9b]|nr:hypothetical protein Pat9b_5023 [Pantoea sp. At-9b]
MTNNRKPCTYVNKYTGKMFYLNHPHKTRGH